jgi:hypothetical protein
MLYILKPSKKGHYNSYIEYFNRLIPKHKCRTVEKEELKKLKPKSNKILLLDFNITDIFQILSWGLKNDIYLIHVSIEQLYLKKNKSLRSFIKKKLFTLLKKLELLKIISTHRGAPYEDQLKSVDTIVYDLQYYDLLPVDNLITERPIELVNHTISESIVAIINTSTDKYDLIELENSIALNTHIKFIIVSRKIDLSRFKNVIQINRFISDNELYYLYKHFNHFLVTTRTNRPSGIFGRTMQFNKFAIILENSFNKGIDYPNSIAIKCLLEINIINFKKSPVRFDCSIFDDSLVLLNKLTD